MIDEIGTVVLAAYDITNNIILVASFIPTPSGGFGPGTFEQDPAFNNSFGYLIYQVAAGSNQTTTDALIHPDGRIMVVGSEN